MSLLSRIDAWGERAPDRVVHRSGDTSMTWRELVARSDALAGALARAGLREGAPVVLRGHKEPELLVGFLGCAKAGHPYVPVDAGVPEARLARIVAAAGAAVVLTPGAVRAMERRGGERPPLGTSGTDPSAALYVMFTSGSTGEPKGVEITHGCLGAFLDWMLTEQRFAPAGETFLNQALFSFDLSVMDTWCALATGGTVVSLTAEDVADYRRLFVALEASGITTWVSTPTFAQLCLAERRFGAALLPALRRFLFCGDVLTPEVAARLLDRFPSAEVWNTYGPTEATVATTSVRIDREMLARHAPLPIGRAMPGTRVTVEDEGGHEVADGVRGELTIVGPNVSRGYLGRADLTARSFFVRDGVRGYRTGDWGSARDGLLFFHGRRDGQVKIAGHRIEPGDVEAHLASLPAVRAAAVVPTFRGGRPDALHAFVVLAERPAGAPPETGAALREALGALVPAYMLPRRIHVLERLPLTPNGKTDRAALAATLGA